ncbi:hypothetical protein IV57_GL001350 [Companilactobacillus kimchiensis]|uniref:Endonuclease/exonuclease/phosphatase domain-containing protein n=1 Tax=Companilactobacillus kimchiensis TaxID=993692 RepID=A0A0R2LDM4_9LACO|nr:hypothetical protein IV57_GL001350 [Companilactobacillus kimchiensis]
MENNNVEIAGLQEVNYDNYRLSKTKYNSLTNFVGDHFQYSYFGNTINFAGGQYGIATISTLPYRSESVKHLYSNDSDKNNDKFIAACENYRFEDKSTIKDMEDLRSEYGMSLVEPRIVTRILINKDGQEIAFYNTHISYASTKLRVMQFKQLVEILEQDDAEYKVIVGDFNADRNTTDWKIFADKFNLANGQEGVWRDTYIVDDDPTMRVNSIDNIITSKNITISNVQTVYSTESDHIPLIADLTLN